MCVCTYLKKKYRDWGTYTIVSYLVSKIIDITNLKFRCIIFNTELGIWHPKLSVCMYPYCNFVRDEDSCKDTKSYYWSNWLQSTSNISCWCKRTNYYET